MTITQAIILAAGRGVRMKPLTDTCPKPLLHVHGQPLIVWHLERLARAGVTDVVINTAWLEEQFPAALGDGSAWGLRIRYSHEGARFGGALETAGGIATALPLLDSAQAFWVLAGDVYAPQFEFAAPALADETLAHLYLVPNPPHNPGGDFGLSPNGFALDTSSGERWTYSTIGAYRAALFHNTPTGQKAALAPLLRQAMHNEQVSAQLYRGEWTDVGTPERLAQLNKETR